ncbi:class I SAM-dependent methyltransferase [Sphingomonas ginsenosidivorax]|uniref:Class I SAM-dependent methyltransferase n=1 Tax=Sphingomonas ginsenosidivorax TaxID=862135 RepID=A0A5C6UCH0_9SPHN|nr:class I SAM-dependent methyltransferase [Sphingomonas ginsenosidivorax]TXC69648.1 class I SAM-dependent methyltransferase [Sphingomonas ginsenosidivorax]
MTNLLIHSMAEFSDLILGALDLAGARHVVEIGAEFGGMSQVLADHVATVDGRLTSIDPSPAPAFVSWAARTPHVTHLAAPSLEVIADLRDVDAWLIDGDHNYYTVLNELLAADAVCARDGRPLLAFLHDVGWPAGRRDMYYAPDRIPDAYRHAHEFGAGAMLDQVRLVPGKGFRGNDAWAMATLSGGLRNGVLTAVEDFIVHAGETGRVLAFAQIPAVFGLGILFDAGAAWSPALATLVAPFHDNPLIATLERNRLLNYLKVIEWQDAAAQDQSDGPR